MTLIKVDLAQSAHGTLRDALPSSPDAEERCDGARNLSLHGALCVLDGVSSVEEPIRLVPVFDIGVSSGRALAES